MFRTRSLLVAALALVAVTSVLPAQVPGTAVAPTTVTLQAQKPESFSLAVTNNLTTVGPLTIADSTAGTSQTYAGTVTVTPTWDLASGRQVQIYSYVTQQFTTGSVTFPNSVLEASATGGTGTANGSWNPYSSTVDTHTSAVLLSTVSPSGATLKQSGSAQALAVSLRLNTTNTYIQPGTYTGIVTFAMHVQ